MGFYIQTEREVSIYVEDINPNGKQTILFIHGWPASHDLFEYQYNDLPAQGFRCIGIDMRGFGKSSKPFDGYTYDALSDDLRKIVDVLQLSSFILAGHSAGGAVAVRYMHRHKGHRVSKLILIAAAVPSFVQQPHFPYGQTTAAVNQLIEGTYSDRPAMLESFRKMFFHKPVTISFAQWFLQLGLQAAGYSTAKLAATLRDEQLFRDLADIHVPALLLHGIHDEVCKPELAVKTKELIPNSRLVWFSESGHGLMWEEQHKFNQELISFGQDSFTV